MSNKAISVYAEALKRQQLEAQSESKPTATSKVTRKTTQTPTQARENDRDTSRESSRNNTRKKSRKRVSHTSRTTARPVSPKKLRGLPTRDAIQEFSFRLRDEFRVKVQAEVPPDWQKELDDIARDLNVKKLELYRYILGDFLGKVNRKPSS